MKRGKRLLILLAIVAAFGVGAYLLNLNTQQQEAAKTATTEEEKTTLLNAAEDDATKLSFTHVVTVILQRGQHPVRQIP